MPLIDLCDECKKKLAVITVEIGGKERKLCQFCHHDLMKVDPNG